MDNDTPEIPRKQCSRKDKCVNPLGSFLPATREYFYGDKKNKNGLRSSCKACELAHHHQWGQANPEIIQARNRRHYSANADRMCERVRRWRGENPDKQRELSRSQRQKNRERRMQQSRQWRLVNPERTRENKHRWDSANREYNRLANLKRKARKRALPFAFSQADWKACLDYWHECCAICGKQAKDLFGTHTIAADHWIPLSKGGGTTKDNIVPLCQGKDGCNNSKHDSEPTVWLERKFGKRRASAILARIQAYFDSLK